MKPQRVSVLVAPKLIAIYTYWTGLTSFLLFWFTNVGLVYSIGKWEMHEETEWTEISVIEFVCMYVATFKRLTHTCNMQISMVMSMFSHLLNSYTYCT